MRIRRSIVAMGLMALVATLPLLGTGGATLSPMAGTVAVNGQNVTAGSSVVAGDTVSVSAQGSARMVVPGSTVIAASKTNFRLVSANSASQIRLSYGMVQVSGSIPVALKTRTVVPASKNAKFTVTALNGPVYVQAVTGNVSIRAGNQSYTVHQGEAATFNDDASAAQGGGGGSIALPMAIGFAAAAAIVTGIIVHYETECSNCVVSPSK